MLNHDTQLDRMFQALGDANRRALINRLLNGPASVSDLAAPMAISLPAVHQHLAVLENAGLITTEKQGRVRTCTLDTTALTQVEVWISERRQLVESRLDALGRFLAKTKEIK
jgi:DNA-binding transcriptional ArsR family regulator